MSPLISLLEKETTENPNKNEHREQEQNESAKECGCGRCSCVKPCANCTCRDRKER